VKAARLFTGSSPLVILTSCDSLLSPQLIRKLSAKGIGRFIACEIPLEVACGRNGGHFEVVRGDLRENDEWRVLDYNGRRAFMNFSFSEIGQPLMIE